MTLRFLANILVQTTVNITQWFVVYRFEDLSFALWPPPSCLYPVRVLIGSN